jgi:putative toxin-antitoxin system antitoxin component (TIGR02293 family)
MIMKKSKKIKPYEITDEPLNTMNEPGVFYGKLSTTSPLKELSFNDFKKLADKIPFSLAEWATILHVSERTLQRYAKNNSAFAPINAERIFLIEKVLKEATITFGKPDKFYDWISRSPYMMEGNLSIQSLSTFDGIQNVLTQLGRIQQGVFA